MSDVENILTSVRVEVRASAAEKRTIGGYAAKFTPARSDNLGGFKEQIAPGAFNRSAAAGWPGVVARYNHDDGALLGTTGSGHLRLRVDDVGLVYEVDLPNARADVYELVERGDVRQSSFAFIADDESWDTDDTGYPLRTLVQARLLDVAPVVTPAYRDTTVALRSLAKKFDAPLEEVRKLAQANELTRFFKRTDGKAADTVRSSHAALAASLALDPNATI